MMKEKMRIPSNPSHTMVMTSFINDLMKILNPTHTTLNGLILIMIVPVTVIGLSPHLHLTQHMSRHSVMHLTIHPVAPQALQIDGRDPVL